MTFGSAHAVETPLPPVDPPTRPFTRRSAAAALAAVVLVAVVDGVIWSELAPRLHFLVTVVGPFPVSEVTAGQVVDADGWFAVLSVAVGVAAGIAAVVVIPPLSRWRAPVGLGLAAIGLFVMFGVGQLLVNHRLVWSWNPVAGDNHEVIGPLVLQAWGIVTVAPIIALVIVLAASLVSDGERRSS